jgi:hypothetical protein
VSAFHLSYSDGRLAAELIAQAQENWPQVRSSPQHHEAADAGLTSRSGARFRQTTKARKNPSAFISVGM